MSTNLYIAKLIKTVVLKAKLVLSSAMLISCLKQVALKLTLGKQLYFVAGFKLVKYQRF